MTTHLPLAPDSPGGHGHAPPAWPPQRGDGTGFKVLFVNPPSIPYTHVVKALGNRQIELVQVIAMPMGILYLSSVLEQAMPGIEVRVLDLAKACRDYSKHPDRVDVTLEEFTARELDKAVADGFKPDWVGLSILFSTAHRSTCHIANVVKAKWPDVPTIVGGMHATNAVGTLLEAASVDYVCRGEAETVVVDLTRKVRAGEDLEVLPGVYGRAKLARDGGDPHESAPLVEDLDTIPYPSWHLLPMREYVFGELSRARKLDTIEQDGEATIVTTRGCPFLCTFCASWTVHGRQMRYRSIPNVVEELRILRDRFDVTVVVPEDDLFTVKKPRIIALCDAVADAFKGTVHFQFPNGLSVATLDDDVVRAMMRMGMQIANIAIESGSPYVQRHIIKKNCNLERARNVIQSCRDHGAIVRAYFIFGFPGETRAMMEQTVAYSATLATDWNAYSIASPLIGTEMYEQMIERGYIDQSFNWDSAFFQDRQFDTPEISAKDLKDLAYDANIRINFFGNYNLRNGLYERAIKLYQEILTNYPGHLAAQYCIGLAREKMGDGDGFRRALEHCHEMLAPGKDPLARQLYDRFGELFPLLDPPYDDLAAMPLSKHGPRPGMPNRARQVV